MPDWSIAGEEQMTHSGLDQRGHRSPHQNAHRKEDGGSGLSRGGAGARITMEGLFSKRFRLCSHEANRDCIFSIFIYGS